LNSKEIAGRLGLKPATLDQYLKLLANDLRLQGRRQLSLWAFQNPGCFVPNAWVEAGLHIEGCACDSIYCTAMRIGASANALEDYRKRRDAQRRIEQELQEFRPPTTD
jgi:hypothetical protein